MQKKTHAIFKFLQDSLRHYNFVKYNSDTMESSTRGTIACWPCDNEFYFMILPSPWDWARMYQFSITCIRFSHVRLWLDEIGKMSGVNSCTYAVSANGWMLVGFQVNGECAESDGKEHWTFLESILHCLIESFQFIYWTSSWSRWEGQLKLPVKLSQL